MRMRALAAGAVLLLAVPLFAQTPPSPPPNPAPAAGPEHTQPEGAALTDLEKALLENLQLRMALLQDEEQSLPQRKADLQDRYGRLIQKIQGDHPGYIWNPQTSSLIGVPSPAHPPAKKEEGKK